MRKFIPLLVSLLLSSALVQSADPAPPVFETPPAITTPAPQTPASSEKTLETPSSSALTSTFRYALGGVLETQLGLNTVGAVSGFGAYTLKFSGSIGAEEAPTAAFSAKLHSSVDLAGVTQVNLGETVLTVYVGDFDLQAGNLRVNWGAVDLFGVLNTINPQDFATRESLPVLALRGTWNLPKNQRLEAVLIPGFTPSTLPSTPSGGSSVPPSLPPNVVGLDPVLDLRPPTTLENVQFGLRFSSDVKVLDGGDVALSFYSGRRHTPTLSTRLQPTALEGQFQAQPVLNYDRVSVLGADSNLTLGDVALRGELAYTFTEDPGGTNREIGNPSLEGTVQAEYTLEKINLTVILNARWQKGESGSSDTTGVNTALVASSELDTRTVLSGVWVQSLFDGSGTLLPSLSYTLADGLRAEGRLGLNYGGTGSSLNPGGTLSGQVYLGFKFSF